MRSPAIAIAATRTFIRPGPRAFEVLPRDGRRTAITGTFPELEGTPISLEQQDVRKEALLREVLWLARSHLRDGWPAFAAEVRASAGLAAMWGLPPHKRAGDGKSR